MFGVGVGVASLSIADADATAPFRLYGGSILLRQNGRKPHAPTAGPTLRFGSPPSGALRGPATWFNLAGPPSLDSCTRDIYPSEHKLDGAGVQRLSLSIAEVAAHLHGQGLSHGDLYGHNILCDDQGHSLLGEFGAASFHPRDGGVEARLLERIGVRAFGGLLGELLERCGEVQVGMRALQQACVQAVVLERPGVAEVVQQLAH